VRTNQPTVGRYLHYLADALLVREHRRYPLAKARNARLPLKATLTDLGVRNAIFRGAPSIWESTPDVVGPLVETVVQTVIRDVDMFVHFYRERTSQSDRRSPIEEVDFVAERTDGTVFPVEVKFRKSIQPSDLSGIRHFMERYKCPWGIVVTRNIYRDDDPLLLQVPLRDFLLAY
jgi:predicted AAA+ superfamily ATPase